MRRRSTFVPSPGVDYDPGEIKLRGGHLSLAGLKAAREEHLIFGLDTLPAAILGILDHCHELHIRWVSEQGYEKSGPYLSSLPAGLHVHYTPSKANHTESQELCQLLRDLFRFSLRCSTPAATFSQPDILSSRFASSASMQYYSLLPSLQQFVGWIQRHNCQTSDVVCLHNAALLNLASYVDLDYDSISHALKLTAFWSKPPAVLMDPVGEWTMYDHWNMALDASPNDKNEVGLLRVAGDTAEPSEIQMEGFLAVVGEDTEPKPTMFFFPSRHHSLRRNQARAQAYSVRFEDPAGLHPTLTISFPSRLALSEPENKPDDSTCALHAYFTLPSVFFVDEYAFPTTDLDPLFTEAHNIVALRSLSGERDLEAPDFVVQKWGSAMLLELATPNASSFENSREWDIKIPLHLRYLEPNGGGTQTAEMPWPVVFWACTAEEGTKFSVNPFDRVNLGYDGLFGPRTMFYHLDPNTSQGIRLVENIDVPVIDTSTISFAGAELFTTILVLGGFAWVSWKVIGQVMWESKWWSQKNVKSQEKKQQ